MERLYALTDWIQTTAGTLLEKLSVSVWLQLLTVAVLLLTFPLLFFWNNRRSGMKATVKGSGTMLNRSAKFALAVIRPKKVTDSLSILFPLDDKFARLTQETLISRIKAHKHKLGSEHKAYEKRLKRIAQEAGAAALTLTEIKYVEFDDRVAQRTFFQRFDIPEEYPYKTELAAELAGFYRELLDDKVIKPLLEGASGYSHQDLAEIQQSRALRNSARKKVQFKTIHRTQTNGPRSGAIDSLVYYNADERDKLIGRDQLIDRLIDEFLGSQHQTSPPPFCWTLIYGDAGSGKSRFALELLAKSEKQLFKSYTPLYWGFIEAGDAKQGSLITSEDIKQWYIDEPVFMVIDYAAIQENLSDIIKQLDRKSLECGQPIRLMLLERSNTVGGTRNLEQYGSSDSHLSQTRFDISEYDYYRGVGIELPTLSDHDTVTIIKNRITRPLTPIETDSWLLQRLNDLTRPGEGKQERRPLFAAMLGNVLNMQEPKANEAYLDGVERIGKRNELIERLIKRDRLKYWFKNDKKPAQNTHNKYENLLALCTFTRGLSIDVLDDLSEQGVELLPTFQEFDDNIYKLMASNNKDRSNLGFLQPDFIGEYFVLDHLKSKSRSEREELIELAWTYGKKEAAQFVRLCHQNHPDLVFEQDYLLPKSGRHLEYVASLLRDILHDWRGSLEIVKQKDLDFDLSAIRFIEERAIGVNQQLRAHIAQFNEGYLGPELKKLIADATESYLFIRAWFISPSVRSMRDLRFLQDETSNDNALPLALVDSSHSLQKQYEQRNARMNLGRHFAKGTTSYRSTQSEH